MPIAQSLLTHGWYLFKEATFQSDWAISSSLIRYAHYKIYIGPPKIGDFDGKMSILKKENAHFSTLDRQNT